MRCGLSASRCDCSISSPAGSANSVRSIGQKCPHLVICLHRMLLHCDRRLSAAWICSVCKDDFGGICTAHKGMFILRMQFPPAVLSPRGSAAHPSISLAAFFPPQHPSFLVRVQSQIARLLLIIARNALFEAAGLQDVVRSQSTLQINS